MGERWQQMRQLFYLKGEGLYKEEDSRVVNTIAFGLGFLALLVAATYFALFVLIRPARDADKKTHEPFDVPAAETV